MEYATDTRVIEDTMPLTQTKNGNIQTYFDRVRIFFHIQYPFNFCNDNHIFTCI